MIIRGPQSDNFLGFDIRGGCDRFKSMEENTKKKRDYLLPGSIVLAALLVVGAIVYSAGKSSGNQAANLPSAAPTGDFTKVLPISAADHVVGNSNAPVKVIEFADLECPFCKDFHQVMQQIADQYATSVAWVFRNFPLPQLHPKAPHEAQASECAAKLGGNDAYWKYIDTIYSITPSNNGLDPAELPKVAGQIGLDVNAFNACLNSTYGQDIITAQSQEAVADGAVGTPYSIVILNQPLSQGALAVINALNAQYQSNPPVFEVSSDKKMFTIGGAMPLGAMQQLFSKLTSS
jgi:protein-disulfide isomerase